jgi:hypothetical protein
MMLALLRPAALAAMLLLAAPAFAEEPAEPQGDLEQHRQRAEELWREGAQKIISGLEQLLKSIPSYGIPEITEDGDIIIPRRRDPSPPPPRRQDEDDEDLATPKAT